MDPANVSMVFPFTDIEIGDLVPPIPPNITPVGKLLSSEDLVRRVNFTFDFHRHFARNCRLDCHQRMVPKKTLHQINSQKFTEVCVTCSRRDHARGDLLKCCSKCKSTRYCSAECQRKDWDKHKLTCRQAEGKSMLHLAQTALSNPFILHEITTCLALIFKVDQDTPQAQRRELSRKVLVARMDLGVEPSDVFETARMYRHKEKWEHKGVEGIFQINAIHEASNSWEHEMSNELRDVARARWQEFRDSCDAQGLRDTPVVYVQICSGDEQVTPLVMDIFHDAIMAAKHTPDYSVPMNPKYVPRSRAPDAVSDRLNHINEHIRYDTENKFSLRTRMSLRNKEVILTGFQGDLGTKYSGQKWCYKMLREPVYDVIRILAEQDYHIATAQIVAEGVHGLLLGLFLVPLGFSLKGPHSLI